MSFLALAEKPPDVMDFLAIQWTSYGISQNRTPATCVIPKELRRWVIGPLECC